jgi:2,4-dienoyl-CoA reductase (NADPH2)
MSTRFPHLLSPGRIGSMELRNRILLSPMGDDLCHEDGTVSDRQLAYAEARARGGAAMVMLGSVAVAHPIGTSNRCQTGISDDRFVPGLRRLADAVHAHGARLGVQLTHAGKIGINDMVAGRPMWVPSPPGDATFDPLFAQVTPEEAAAQAEPMASPTLSIEHHEMTAADVAVLIDWFAAAVVRARGAGIDGCELHAGHGYLLDEYLSPTTNHRTDAYGGSLAGRARLLVEVLQEIRRRVGSAYPVWVRLNAVEYFTDGTTLDDAIETARLAEAAGADAIHVSTYADPTVAIGFTEAHTTHFPGHFVEHARAVKAAVTVPVIAVGRIEPEVAERGIGEGAFDLVAMGRKLLADPDLPNKLAEDRPQDVRPCMYHYRCISQIFIREGVRCAITPATGRERELRLEPATRTCRVLVVGGGPAGMETARMAALRGHDVVLAEAAEHLGGRLRFAARTYAPNADVLAWLERQVRSAGVDVRLGCAVDAAVVREVGAEVVVAAIGGRWAPPAVPGADAGHVRTVDQLDDWLLAERPLAGHRVVVVGGGRAGLGLADVASARGHEVTVLEASGIFAAQIGLPGRWRLIHDLRERGVRLVGDACVDGIGDASVSVTVAGVPEEIAADVVLVASVEGRPEIAAALETGGVPVHAVGDCRAPGFLEGAMLDAATLAVGL